LGFSGFSGRRQGGFTLSQRTCGSCTACCKTHQILEIGKFGGIWCEHCTIGQGCSIYPDRPEECRAFECQWLKGYGADDERPDCTKVVPDYCTIEAVGCKVCSLWEVSQGALTRRYAKNLHKDSLQSGIPVLHVYLTGRQVLFLPSGCQLSDQALEALRQSGVEITD
jgi:hypothetical protein